VYKRQGPGVAAREHIAPEVIASGREIDALASGAGEGEDLAVTRGWRRVLVGDRLLAIARGEVAMRYDAVRKEVVADPVDTPPPTPGGSPVTGRG
jgi:hypothetical protein